MILVADSGSSKTDWLLELPGNSSQEYKSDGLNPYFKSEKDIVKVLQTQCSDLIKQAGDIDEIYFFGAGCSNPDKREVVTNALSHIFPKTYISVDSDLLASAYATCGYEKGLCCVLGSGSNISFFNGEDIFEGKHGLGFVLGDEGSGNWFGKKLIADYFYGTMPTEIEILFAKEHNVEKESVIKNVYQQKNANAYLASFANFLSSIHSTPYAQQLIKAGIVEFIETNIKTYPEYHNVKCHFVGSIAYHFSRELTALCLENDIEVGKIIKRPINDLLEFILHRNSLNS